MSIIDRLLILIRPPPPIIESPDDIEEVACKFKPDKMCLRCKLCGNISGESRKIFHLFGCPYSLNHTLYGPYDLGERVHPTERINPELYEEIVSDQYAIISSNSTKPIIGTHGATSCIILCMRDRTNTNTILAHITNYTINPLEPFLRFSPENSDVYIIGGYSGSVQEMITILSKLKENNYTIRFAHIIDDDTNKFAINCITGETWLNKEVHDHVPTKAQQFAYTMGALSNSPKPYYQVKIPNKSSGGKRRTRRSRRSRRPSRRTRK